MCACLLQILTVCLLGNKVRRLILFLPRFFFFPSKFCPAEILVTTGLIVSEIWGHGRYGREVVQKGFKIQNVRLTYVPKTAQFFSSRDL